MDESTIVKFRSNWTLYTGDGKIRAITLVGAVFNRTVSAQLETAPTKHGERKCLSVFRIHYNESMNSPIHRDPKRLEQCGNNFLTS